jgi:hypothetical protein
MTSTPSAPASFAAWIWSITSPSRMDPVPTMAGPRPLQAATVSRARCSRSGSFSAQNSPVQPAATMPVAPASNRRAMLAVKDSSSMERSRRKGVVIAGIGPVQVTDVRSTVVSPLGPAFRGGCW